MAFVAQGARGGHHLFRHGGKQAVAERRRVEAGQIGIHIYNLAPVHDMRNAFRCPGHRLGAAEANPLPEAETMPETMIGILPLGDIAEVAPGDDLADILARPLAALTPRDGDVLAVTQKIVSKAEGRFVDLRDVTPGPKALELARAADKDPRLVELVLAESTEIVRVKPGILITRHRLGLVMANAGIDASNIGGGRADHVLLLPEDPDASAMRLREKLGARFGVQMGVVITDSFGRPWRNGVVNVAIGSAGFPALYDKRGLKDRDGRVLRVTQIAYGDLIASATGLVMGEAEEGIPAALVRGCTMPDMDIPARALVRNLDEDLFR
ncbi:MAG TPA: coenzyme F420-0:L-glutamate ligase [Gaiellaceae bacterium]|nr:coenzyme F420-0:L-glutamate ligase [Gaiellaceae bacterium]